MCDYGFMDRCGLFLVFRGKLRVRNLFQVLSYVTSFKGNDPLGSIGVWSVARWFWVRVHQLAGAFLCGFHVLPVPAWVLSRYSGFLPSNVVN